MSNSSLKITKWGNSQGIRLPMAVMELLSLKTGDELQMTVESNSITLTPNKKRRMSIAERFANYEGPTQQEEIWSDEVVGKEVF
jgi:antitoxin MazE|nr:MAG TPA: Growth regulator [Caudoviricetes sp.]